VGVTSTTALNHLDCTHLLVGVLGGIKYLFDTVEKTGPPK